MKELATGLLNLEINIGPVLMSFLRPKPRASQIPFSEVLLILGKGSERVQLDPQALHVTKPSRTSNFDSGTPRNLSVFIILCLKS